MKRSPMPPRTTRLRSTGRLKPIGVTKLKKQKRYKAFLSSAVWKRIRKEALARAGFQCEALYVATAMPVEARLWRCSETDKLTVHHTTYARFGGDELPEDLEVRCKGCHDRLHALEGKRIA